MTCFRSRAPGALLLVAALLAATACRDAQPVPARADAAPAAAAPAEVAPPPAATRPRIVALGDSLTAGLGLRPGEAYPALLQERLAAAGLDYEVVNAGVSGDTSAGGLRRLDWALDGDVRVLIVALGGNDGLRGLPAEELKANLSRIIERAQGRDIAVVLAGMEAPPNFGQAYTAAFRQVYPALAKEYGVALVPFLLAGVAGVDSLNQRDGIHPDPEGARKVADNIWAVLEPLASRQAAGAPAP
jgi:acyl-CoA thioesterase-1